MLRRARCRTMFKNDFQLNCDVLPKAQEKVEVNHSSAEEEEVEEENNKN